MKPGYSIRARLLLGAALVLLLFMAGAGIAVQRAHTDSVRTAHYDRLQATVYLLLAGAELDDAGRLQLPAELAEPKLSVPGSGLYAGIYNVDQNETWRSASTVGVEPPLVMRKGQPGEWVYDTMEAPNGRKYLAVTYNVRWSVRNRAAPLVLVVLEDQRGLKREVAVFARTLWSWLGGAALLLLLAQLLLLRWGLSPLRAVAQEIRRIEAGDQERVEGRYPDEISGLTENLNALIQQERVRQTRYKEALSFLAHSLKTPLAVLRNALGEPAELPAVVEQQVRRMDDIVQHQLGRAAAGGAARFAPAIAIAPVLERVREALGKVYAEKGLDFTIACAPELQWRIDQGDLFEMMGNLMDNAAKWARSRVEVRATREAGQLRITVDDDGPGFSDTTSVLQLHVRGDERVPGHGVGLAVVNELVGSYHGELELRRAPLGGGRVEVCLPSR
ncbi:HAMP domain-containing protein [Ramlibacter sp. G-1-2-2]|uniref:histidine kinase n=1 Tax=Ramlibacter agri TaxID=2728837 RepID=A0A848H9N8_9BURK|nr:ATP-binding protein [Ramlibacter agri]NML47204.1 HAMP domain-containing protein [Ramlibacter agri]